MEGQQHYSGWVPMSVEERAILAEQYGVDTLYMCMSAWAMGRQWVNRETGQVQRARCNRWDCLYCGPRKVDLWRQLVHQANPTLFLTLSKAGKTVEQAARAFTTFVQALRRGSKGLGRNHIGARLAYPVEFFAVLEEHERFEELGFHWHILIKGVESIPYKEVVQPLWMSATHYNEETGEGAKIGHIERIHNARAIGYVTKYLTKAVHVTRQGTREVTRIRPVMVEDEQGKHHMEQIATTERVTSRAHRIRYSRQFFPAQVDDMRRRLFAGLGVSQEGKQGDTEQGEPMGETCEEKGGDVQPQATRSPWTLMEARSETQEDIEEYKRVRYGEVLREVEAKRAVMSDDDHAQYKAAALADVAQDVGSRMSQGYWQRRRRVLAEVLQERQRVSRRVITMWHYQYQQQRRRGV